MRCWEGREKTQKTRIVPQDGFPWMALPSSESQACTPRCRIQPKFHTPLFFSPFKSTKNPPKPKGNHCPPRNHNYNHKPWEPKGRKQPKMRFEVATEEVWGEVPPSPGVPLTSEGGGGARDRRRLCSSTVPLTGLRIPSSLGGQGL